MSMDLAARALAHLERLVAADTRNPPRRTRESGVMDHLRGALGATFSITETDLGDGSIALLAVRGAPRVLFNFHVDTVPAAAGWTRDPFALLVEGDRAIGLGACDVKGGLAAMLAAAESATGDLALLVTSDEEAGQARCVKWFCEELRSGRAPIDPACIVVGEPTSCRAVLGHRGVITAAARFSGHAGHASSAEAVGRSAVHELVRWAGRALDAVGRGELGDVRFNIGRIEGGEKPNMVAEQATARFGIRTPEGARPEAVLERLVGLTAPAAVETGFVGPSLATPSGAARAAVDEVVARLGVEVSPPVDFWTEAALFSSAGFPTIVLGPGSIAQAHTADEHVAVAELVRAAEAYTHMVTP